MFRDSTYMMNTIIIMAVISITAGSCEGRKRHVIGKIRFSNDKTSYISFTWNYFSDTCVILGENVTEDIMESFRLANEDVLDKLSPPLRLSINQTDIYREGEGYSYDNTSK